MSAKFEAIKESYLQENSELFSEIFLTKCA